MTREAFKAILDPLVLALRAEMDLPTWTAYFRSLEDVPPALLASAVARAMKSATFLPKPGELRQWAEEARQALMAAHPFTPCAQCSSQGWAYVIDHGVAFLRRCACWTAHQQRLAALGVGPERLAEAMVVVARDWTEAREDGMTAGKSS